MSDLYTFFMDYKGGTYVSQVEASFEDACKTWVENLGFRHIDKSQRRALRLEISLEKPTPLKGLKNAWCVSAILENDLALVHFVKTDRNLDETSIC